MWSPRQLGAAITQRRRDLKLTQQQLADQAGVSRSWLIRLENGHGGAQLRQVLSVLAALNLAINLTVAPPQEDPFLDMFENRP